MFWVVRTWLNQTRQYEFENLIKTYTDVKTFIQIWKEAAVMGKCVVGNIGIKTGNLLARVKVQVVRKGPSIKSLESTKRKDTAARVIKFFFCLMGLLWEVPPLGIHHIMWFFRKEIFCMKRLKLSDTAKMRTQTPKSMTQGERISNWVGCNIINMVGIYFKGIYFNDLLNDVESLVNIFLTKILYWCFSRILIEKSKFWWPCGF